MSKFEEVKEFLSQEIMTAMYMEEGELDVDALFSSYGLESSTLVRIISELQTKFDIELKVEDILPHQSVNRAAKVIFEILEGKD